MLTWFRFIVFFYAKAAIEKDVEWLAKNAYSQIPLNTDTSLLQRVCFVIEERKPHYIFF